MSYNVQVFVVRYGSIALSLSRPQKVDQIAGDQFGRKQFNERMSHSKTNFRNVYRFNRVELLYGVTDVYAYVYAQEGFGEL